MAVSRAIVFLVVIGCIHLAGYLLYVQQFSPDGAEPDGDPAPIGFSPCYWPALKFGIILQVVFGTLTALLLDGGRSFEVFKVAFVGYWIGILIVIGRRPSCPSPLDKVLIRYGIVLIVILIGLIAPAVWSLIGESTLSGLERLRGE